METGVSAALAIFLAYVAYMCLFRTTSTTAYYLKCWRASRGREPGTWYVFDRNGVRIKGVLMILASGMCAYNALYYVIHGPKPNRNQEVKPGSVLVGSPRTPYAASKSETYANNFFAFQMPIPEGWDIQSREDDAGSGKGQSGDAQPASSTPPDNPASRDRSILLQILRHPVGGSADPSERLTCISADLAFLKVSSGRQYLIDRLAAAKKKAEGKGITVAITADPAPYRIGKVDFLYQELAIGRSNGQLAYDRQFVVVIKDRLLVFSLMYEKPQQLTELTALLDRVTFKD